MASENRNFKIFEGCTKFAVCEGDCVRATVNHGMVSFDIIDSVGIRDTNGDVVSPEKTRHIGKTQFFNGDTFASAWRRVW